MQKEQLGQISKILLPMPPGPIASGVAVIATTPYLHYSATPVPPCHSCNVHIAPIAVTNPPTKINQLAFPIAHPTRDMPVLP